MSNPEKIFRIIITHNNPCLAKVQKSKQDQQSQRNSQILDEIDQAKRKGKYQQQTEDGPTEGLSAHTPKRLPKLANS